MKERLDRRKFLQIAGPAIAGVFLAGCGQGESPPPTPGPTPTPTSEPTSTPRPRPTFEPTPTFPAMPEGHFPKLLTEKDVAEYFEKVDWDADEIERRIKENKAAGKNCMFWPLKIEPGMKFTAGTSYVFTSPWESDEWRYLFWLDVPPETVIRGPISGKVEAWYGGQGDETVQIKVIGEDGMEASFHFAVSEELEHLFGTNPKSYHGRTQAGENLLIIHEGAKKRRRFGSFVPLLDPPRSFIMCLSDNSQKKWCFAFDWLRTDSGKIAY